MQNLLRDDIKILLKNFIDKDLILIESKWKDETYLQGKLDEKKVETFAQILYENYVNRIDIRTQFKDVNIESIKPYQLKYNVRRFWFKEENTNLSIEPNEIVVSQDGIRLIVKEGEYINGGELESLNPQETSEESKKEIKEFVYVYLPRKVFKQKDNFYIQTYGDFLLRNYYDPIIRFYFSLEPKRKQVQQFIDKIKDFFNERRIPFQLKTPLKLQNFGRSDTLVLYIAQNHFFYVREFINELRDFALRKEILRTNIPLFVKKIYEGVGFAEDPYFANDSFGMQRVKLIIKVINDLLGLGEKVNINSILEGIKKDGYNLDEFYKNPYTNFNYDFENFNTPISLNPPYTFKTGKYRFYKYNLLALEYALDLVERAVWNSQNELIWFSYTENEDNDQYKLLSEDEVYDIFWFLNKVVQIGYNRQFFTKSVLKIIDDKVKQTEQKKQYKERVEYLEKSFNLSIKKALKNISFNDFEKEYDKIISDVQQWSNESFTGKTKLLFGTFNLDLKSNLYSLFSKNPTTPLPIPDILYRGSIADFAQNETLKLATAMYPYVKMEYPILNKYVNYEYCPTDEGKLRIASIMLCVYCPSLYE